MIWFNSSFQTSPGEAWELRQSARFDVDSVENFEQMIVQLDAEAEIFIDIEKCDL